MDKATQRSTFARSIQGLHFDFISILALVETLAIDLLPIRWQPALNLIGHGGTAKVLQSPVDLQLSLAFKRPLESTVLKPESGSFELLVSELLVLSNPATRYHPHLVMLEGICLEMDAEEGAVSPIFVFEKAREGDLHQFMSSSGKHLGIQERLDLCKDIATAIQVLHACRIAHGDINPRNVLVFRDGAVFYAKVADFGYSAVVIDEQTIGLPTTWPWNAPECEEQWWFTFLQARKTDLFSFGLLCLWILFKDSSPEDGIDRELASDSGYSYDCHWIDTLKRTGRLLSFAHDQVQKINDLSQEEQAGLDLFFQSILSEDPERRELNLRYIPPLSEQQESGHHRFEEWQRNSQFYLHTDPDPAVHFQLSGLLFNLITDDFRLWEYISRCLQNHASCHSDLDSRNNAAFQLAFCYELGFGCSRSRCLSLEWLEKSNRTVLDLEHHLQIIRNDGHRKKSLVQPFLGRANVATKYKKDNILSRAYQVYEAAATNMELVLGKFHSISIEVRLTLATILDAQGHLERAEATLNKLEQECKETLTDDHRPSMGALVNFYVVRNQWEKAESWSLRLMAAYERNTIAVNPHVKEHHLSALAINSFNRGRETEGIELSLQDVAFCKRTYGESNHRTLTAVTTLATMYIEQKRYTEAKEIIQETISAGEKVWPEDDLILLNMLSHLTRIQRTRQDCREAEKLCLRILPIYRRVLGDEDRHTLSISSELSNIFMHQGRWSEAEDILCRNVKIRYRVFGEEDPDALVDTAVLARLYYALGKCELANSMRIKLVELCEKRVGIDHSPVRKGFGEVMASLATRYRRRAFWIRMFGSPSLVIAALAKVDATYAFVQRLLYRYC